MAVIKITKENFEELLRTGRLLIDFYADWCGPCRMMASTVEAIAEERDDVIVGKVNVDEEPELAEANAIFSIPTFVLFENGEEAARVSGAMAKAQFDEFLSR